MVNAFDDSAPTEICRLEIVGANATNPRARTLPYGYTMRAGPPSQRFNSGQLCPTMTGSFSKGFPTSCVAVLTRPSGICPNDCASVAAQSRMRSTQSPALDEQIECVFQASEPCQRVGAVEGIGPLTATALVAAMSDGKLSRMVGSSLPG
jgi:hypothetical protein